MPCHCPRKSKKRHIFESVFQDPLAELVKIDPKSIGVGQYQHDMNQKKLGETLGGVVEDCHRRTCVSYLNGLSSILLPSAIAAGYFPVICFSRRSRLRALAGKLLRSRLFLRLLYILQGRKRQAALRKESVIRKS